MRLLFVVGAAKIAAGLAAALWIPPALALPVQALPSWYYVGLILIFGLSGAVLYLGGSHDARAMLLGMVLVLFGTLFTDRLVARALPALPIGIAGVFTALASLHVNALVPYVLWRFAWSFPRVHPALVSDRVADLVATLALIVGIILTTGNVLLGPLAAGASAGHTVNNWLSPNSRDGWFWQVLSLLTIPSLLLLVLKQRWAAAAERRRLAWVVAGIVAGTFPMVLHVFLATSIPAYAAWVSDPRRSRAIGIGLTAASLITPAATAYAVVMDRVLEVRFVVRRAVQYLLARYTVMAMMVATAIAIATAVYQNRHRPLADLLRESPVFVIGIVAAAAVFLRRRSLLDAIDRRFFREQYDAKKILLDLVDLTQRAETTRDIVKLITGEVDRALHLERISLLLLHDDSNQLCDPEGRVPSLDADGALGSLIGGSHAPLDVDLSSDGSLLGRLPDNEREWLADANTRLIVPLFGATDRPLGVLALGEKRSELPFTQEDRKLMTAVAASAASTLEQKLRQESPSPDGAPSARTHAAWQCIACGWVHTRPQAACDACGNQLQAALLPAIFVGKFEIERQIGAGGMGVVYRARDLTLDRLVALKVLPRVVPQAASRLRREARAMATMQHPHLAVIHALESWRGSPVLVLEFLSGGTVADRLRFGVLPVATVVGLGMVIGDVLQQVHRAGYLHRDVKPSNIGYTDHGTAKLMDFGLVRLMDSVSAAGGAPSTTTTAALDQAAGLTHRSFETGVHQFVGTPGYLSPEAVAMGPPGQTTDLWALAVTLYEGLTGRNPFSAPTVSDTLQRISSAAVPDPRTYRPECPDGLAAFFSAALNADRARRPQSAAEFVERLRAAAQ
jgi:tRNA A-37 threonylcarbamoyl transferase component Bud32